MPSKDDIQSAIASLIASIRNPPAVMNFLPPYTRKRFSELLTDCVSLQKDIYQLPEGHIDIFEAQSKFFSLEAEARRLRAKLLILPSFAALYLGTGLAFWIFQYVDVTGFIKSVLKVEAPERLLALGVAGAFLYLATSLLVKVMGSKDPLSKVIDFSIRLTLAIVVPIVLVVLFFSSDGNLQDFRISPELLAFGCGYSAKLVMDILSKLVEKASKMIEAI